MLRFESFVDFGKKQLISMWYLGEKLCLIFNEKSESCFDLRELNEINEIISLSDCMCIKCVGRCLIFGVFLVREKLIHIFGGQKLDI